MEKITIEIFGTPYEMFHDVEVPSVTLVLDETGKHVIAETAGIQGFTGRFFPGSKMTLTKKIPNRVMNSFTKHTIARIMSKDELPSKTNTALPDGIDYFIFVSKGEVSKMYYADEDRMKTYPLLRYFASWYRQELSIFLKTRRRSRQQSKD